ncbi:unnamed protein product [Macrosiphum euphorbiae]|uniref:C2H2-type domain-containing protein n=1 Tax=Macrosiphum euphorbiae TaxID=13131 RepID=A0AAV0VH80_9HEMI|nr:unnamed protein product [Macrosiphum euphorbiae]
MLNSLRDGQINYGTTNCPSAHVPPHNVASIHQNSLISTEPSTPVYQWNANHRLEHLYGFHSRYYNLDFPTPYPPATNQYVPTNVYGQNFPQCCQPCCRLRSQNIPKASPPQVLYNPRPVQQLNRSYKSKKTLKTPCSEQFLPYIPNDLPVKYDTQNCYQQKYSSSYLNNTNYCPPANNLWIPPAANPNWSNDRLRPTGRHTGSATHDFSREKNYQRLPNYQGNPYSKPTSATNHIPYNYIPPLPDVHDYRPPVYHNPPKNNTTEYVTHDHSSRFPILSQNIQNPSSLQQYYNTQPVPYSDVQIPSESFKPSQITSKDTSKSNLNVREFLATWDEGEEEIGEKSSETAEPIVVLDCMTLDGDALTKIQEKLNVVSYENLEKVLKENQNPLVITSETNAINSLNNKLKLPSKSNFEPLDYTKRETGIIKPFITEKKISPELTSQSEKSYSVNFDGMVAWYGKKNTDISSTDLIERLADRIFNLSKSQENEGVSFGTAAYTGQITQTNRSIESSDKNTSKYIQSPQMFDLQHHADKCIEPPSMNKLNGNKDSIPKVHSFVFNESNKASTIKSKNSSCIVENITKKCLNVTNEETSPWHLDQGVHEQHLNTSLYDHSVTMKPLDFSSLTDETKGNPFVFEKITSSDNKPNDSITNQCNKVFNQNNSYNSIVSNNQHSIQQIDASNRNFPVIVSPHRQEYNGFHESVIQRTGCDKNKHDKVPTQTDFESINWNLSNDLDKIMKNTNMIMEPSCLYDRSNYNILDGMNSEKNISTRWKDNVPSVDLTLNSKSNSHHDSFFDGWSFIESYENHSGKKIMNTPTNDNSHHQLFPNQLTPLEESTKNNNNSSENHHTNDILAVKDMPLFSKSNDLLPSNRPSRDVFNLNNRIPDFSDGFELPVINEPQEYLQFKKDDNEHRADGSIFEHLNEPKCITTLNETLNYRNDQNKLDFVGLPSFKEKEPLAPVSAPSKLNIVKPTLRDPSQIYTVIKQKLKYDNTCVDNDSVVTNTTENSLKDNLTNTFNTTDLKSKYNSGQINQFDVWSEKFVLKGNSNNSSCAVVQCDVEITQFKSTPENRNTLPKSNMSEHYQDKTMILPENTNCNLADNKINIIENDKINSNDFLNCLESTKTDDQKYRDTFDEFETSFGFDIHCNNESNKSFHEDIVDKCFEERINDQIGDQEINKIQSINTSDTNTTSSNNTQLPFQCDFQSSFLIKNYFDENKNKTVVLDQQETGKHEKSDTTVFKYHNENVQEFELQNSEDIHSVINSVKNSDFNMDCHVRQIHNTNENNNSNFINKVVSYKSQHENTKNICKISSIKKNNFDYLNIENRNFVFDNNKKSILEPEISKETTIVNNSIEDDSISQIKHNDLNTNKRFNIRKNSNVDFESNIFELKSKSTSKIIPIETNKKHESDRNQNSFKSKLNSNNTEEVEHNVNRKIIFELDNNNCGIHSLEKMDAFDFNTRIIQNLGIECSINNIEKPTNSNEIFTNESQMKTNCGFEINDHNNKGKLKTNYKNTLDIQEELQIKETSDLNCNNDAQRHNLIETENINHENNVDRVFEIGCIVNNVQDKLNLENPKTQTDLDFQNTNTENNNLNNCNTGGNSNRSNNSEVENIFENIYDNLSTLNTEKNDTNILENSYQNDIKCDVSKSQEITEDLNLKNNNSDVIEEICEGTNMEVLRDASDKQFKETDNVLLQELVNYSTDNMTTVSVQHNELINDEKSKSTLIEYSTDDSNMNKNSAISVEQHTEDIKEGDIQSNDKNNWKPIKKMETNTVQGDATLNIFEKLRCDILNAVKNTDKKEYTQNNCSESSSFNSFVLNSQQNSNEIYEVEDSINSGPCTLSHVELIHHQNSNEAIEIKGLNSYGPNLLNHGESMSQHRLTENVQAVDLTSSRPNLFHYDESISIHRSEETVDAVDLTCSGFSSLNHEEQPMEMLIAKNSNNPQLISVNHDESKPQQNSNEIYEIDDSITPRLSSLSHTELINNQNSNAVDKIDDSIKCESNLLNNELTFQKYSDEMVEIDSVSSLKHDELKYHKHLNEINEVEDSISSGPNSINQDELEFQQNSNSIYESDDLNSSRSCSINQDELEFQKNSNSTDESDDLTSSGPCSINQDEIKFQRNPNEIYEPEEFTRYIPSSINQDEFKYHQNVNEIYEVEDSTRSRPSSKNQDELELQQNSMAIYKSEDFTSSVSCSINRDEVEFQQNANEIYEAGDFTRSKPSSINQVELKYHQHVNEIYEVEASTRSRPSSINQDELDFQRNSNKTDVADDLHISGLSPINKDKLEFQQNSNEIYEYKDLNSSINQDELELQPNSNETDKAEDLTTSEHSSLNQDELKCQQNSNTINDSEDLTISEPSTINQNELEFQHNSNEIYEAVDLTISRPSLLNHVEYKSHNNLNKIVEDEDLIGSVGSFLNHNELICQEMFVEPSSINNSAISEHNFNETNNDSCKETDYKSVVNDTPLPRVKFILKCHRRNMIKTNIFDEESTMPYKKLKVVKDEKIITRHIFKKRNAFYKQYKPWKIEYRKESIIESNDRNQIESIETTGVPPTTIHPDNIVQQVQTLCEGKKDDNKLVSLLDRTYDHDGERDVEVLNISVGVEGDTVDVGDYNRLLDTPIPSPFSDFQSEDNTPEHCGGEVYWDKSLEDEYKSVLHKTISKLAKVRTNVRDKFNSRLLARRVNETKRRRRRRLLVADKAAVVIVGRVDDPVIKPVVAAFKVSKNPMYKIKVQLPWGRIFNMNAVRNKTKDTKIELGPAKVEVRLSRTPGEWQVAACRSMTSPKSVVVVRRIVLQRATSPTANDYDVDDHHHNQRHDDGGQSTSDNRSHELSRKLPKIVIRRNGQDNNYTSYVSSSGFESGGSYENGGGDDKKDGCGDVEDNGGGGVPQLMVRLVRDRKLDAMAVEGVTTLHLKHLVPLSESDAEASMELDMHCAKRVRYS